MSPYSERITTSAANGGSNWVRLPLWQKSEEIWFGKMGVGKSGPDMSGKLVLTTTTDQSYRDFLPVLALDLPMASFYPARDAQTLPTIPLSTASHSSAMVQARSEPVSVSTVKVIAGSRP